MKNNRGFTLVEILGVIVILATLMIILVPALNNSSTRTKEKTYETKINLIENAAVLYGQDNYGALIASGNVKNIKVKDLIPEYYTADNEIDGKLVEDPRDNTNYLDDYTIKIEVDPQTRKVTAKVQE